MTGYQAYLFCLDNNKRIKEYESIMLRNPCWAYMYARDIIKGRWQEAETIILKFPYYVYHYALDVIKGRWPEAERIIIEDGMYWEEYCNYFKIKNNINWKLGL